MVEKNFYFLRQAIISNDIDYLQNYIMSNKTEQIIDLNIDEKTDLIIIIHRNLQKFGMLKEIFEILKKIIDSSDIKNEKFRKAVDKLNGQINKQCNSYSRILYLKGKLDFLKSKSEENTEKNESPLFIHKE